MSRLSFLNALQISFEEPTRKIFLILDIYKTGEIAIKISFARE